MGSLLYDSNISFRRPPLMAWVTAASSRVVPPTHIIHGIRVRLWHILFWSLSISLTILKKKKSRGSKKGEKEGKTLETLKLSNPKAEHGTALLRLPGVAFAERRSFSKGLRSFCSFCTSLRDHCNSFWSLKVIGALCKLNTQLYTSTGNVNQDPFP